MRASFRSEFALVLTALAAFILAATVTLYLVNRFVLPSAKVWRQEEQPSRQAEMPGEIPPLPVSHVEVVAATPRAVAPSPAAEPVVTAPTAPRPVAASRVRPRPPRPLPAAARGDISPQLATARPPRVSEDSLALHYADLRRRGLFIPVRGVTPAGLRRLSGNARGAHRPHDAIDIFATRNTPVQAVEDGRITKLAISEGGGVQVYQVDRSGRYAYQYAHLARWAPGLIEGKRIARGQLIGYVGTSGDAPPDTPHLHFAITLLVPGGRSPGAVPLNPYLVFLR